MRLRHHFNSFLWLMYITIMLIVVNDMAAPYQWDAIRQSFVHGYFSGDALQSWALFAYYFFAAVALFACIKISYEYGLLLLLCFWCSMVAERTFRNITGHTPTIADLMSIQDDWHRDDRYWPLYWTEFSYAVLWTGLLIIPLLWYVWHNRDKNQRHFLWFFTPFLGMSALFYALFFMHGENALQRFPKGFDFMYSGSVAELNVMRQAPFGSKLGDAPEGHAIAPKIIFIVDQGVSYNEFAKLQMGKVPYVFDYGRAWSAGNCSVTSDAILRRGGWDRELEQILPAVHEVTSLFELGKQVGYATTYIDNRNVLGSSITKHYFDETEISFIDNYWDSTDDVDMRDVESIKRIPRELKREKLLLLINKIGAQQPFGDNIPVTARSGDQKHNYQQTLERNVKGYIEQLISVLDDQTIVFYTSDHGQQFDKKRTNCNGIKDVNEDEFAVPFLIISKNVPFLQTLLPQKTKYENRMTHLEIAESVRNALGIRTQEMGSVFKDPQMLNRPFCGIVGSIKPVGHQPLLCYPLTIPAFREKNLHLN